MNCYLSDFIEYILLERGYSKKTAENYQRYINRFLKYLYKINITNLFDITHHHLTEFLVSCVKSGLGYSSVKFIISAIKSSFNFFIKENYIEKNPFSYYPTPKPIKKVHNILTQNEVKLLIEEPHVLRKKRECRGLLAFRDTAILELLYGSGLRVSELCNLKRNDICMSGCYLKVMNGKGMKERIVPLSSFSIFAINEYWEWIPSPQKDIHAFLSIRNNTLGIKRGMVWRLLKKYGRSCKLKKNMYPHILRHSFACHLLENGAGIRFIQDLLGHEHINTTGDYLQIRIPKLKKSFSRCHPRFY